MTLNQIDYFYETASCQHYNRAAERLHISEPSLSRAISNLEQELGVELFERRGRGVVLTKAGQIFLGHAHQIREEILQAKNVMQGLAGDGGQIDVAYVSPLAYAYIPQTMRAFLEREENRNVTFRFYQDVTTRNVAGLKEGHYDLIFGARLEKETEIEFVPVIRQEMVAIMPKGHPLEHEEFIGAEAFSHYPVLAYDIASGLGRLTRDFYEKHGLMPDYVCEAPDENGIAALAAQGFGIAVVADVEYIRRPDITVRRLAREERFYHQVYMGYLRGRYRLPAVERLIAFVRQQK